MEVFAGKTWNRTLSDLIRFQKDGKIATAVKITVLGCRNIYESHSENGGFLGLFGWGHRNIINPIYTLCNGYLLGPNPLSKVVVVFSFGALAKGKSFAENGSLIQGNIPENYLTQPMANL